MKLLLKNFFYQVLFQLTRIILPIITFPIIARALEPEGVGLYNYTSSIIQYFIMVSGLGFTLLGSRKISIAVSKKEDISQVFSEIFLAKGFMTIIVFLFFLLGLFFLPNKRILLSQSLNLIYIFLDVSWYFMGTENFKVTSFSYLSSQIIGFILIIFFVKNPSDIYIYICIQAGILIFPNLIIWPILLSQVKLKFIKFEKLFKTILESSKFFISQISNTILNNINKTLLGALTTNVLVGYYTNSLVVNTVFITIIMTVDTVMIPRLSAFFSLNKRTEMLRYLKYNIRTQLFFSIAIMFGMIAITPKFVPWFFGDKFNFIIKTIPILSVLVVIMPLSMTISKQYLLPQGRTREYNNSMIFAVFLTVILDFLLIGNFSIWGAILTNILVEAILLVFRLYNLKSDNIKLNILGDIFKYFVCGVIMVSILFLSTNNLRPSIFTNFIQIIIGFSCYMLLTFLFGVNPLFNLKRQINK